MLRRDDFPGFIADRQQRLLTLIERAMGKPIYRGDIPEEGEDVEDDEDRMAGVMLKADPKDRILAR